MAKHKFKENDIVEFKTQPHSKNPGDSLKHYLIWRRYKLFQIVTLRDSDCLIVPYLSETSENFKEKVLGIWISYNKIKYLGNPKDTPLLDILYKK